MKIDTLPIGLYGENSYVLHDHDEVLLIDPGAYPKEILKHIDLKKEKVQAIVLTHGHEDHTGAVDDLVDELHCPVYMDMDDYPLVSPDNAKSMRGYVTPVYAPIQPLTNYMMIGSFSLHVYKTPGHTAGSTCIRYRNVLFAGDTLFAGSCGRTDLYSGDETAMLQSLRFLKDLPRDLIVYPGHGPATTIGEEADTNPFMMGI